MKIIAKKDSLLFDEKGNAKLTLTIDNWRDKQVIKELEDDKDYRLEFSEVRSKRSIEQNKLLWKIINEINTAYNGKYGSSDEYEIYTMLLERANAKYDFIACLPEAEEVLRKNFRAVKFIKKVDLNGKEGNAYKVFIGSSQMNINEMKVLINTALDVAAELDIDTSVYERSR